MNKLRESIQEYHKISTDKHDLYYIPAPKLLHLMKNGILCRWENNREEDAERVKMIKSYSTKQGYIDGFISLAYVNNKLVCYDGNHRRCAITKELSPILVSIMWHVTNEDIVEKFNVINQSISVPMIHLEKFDAKTKMVIVDYVKDLVEKYKSLSSTSAHCQRPNFNRDYVVDNVTNLMKELDLEPESLVFYLTMMNDAYQKELYGFKKCTIKSDKVRQKCEKHQLWLFASSKDIDKAFLHKVIEGCK